MIINVDAHGHHIIILTQIRQLTLQAIARRISVVIHQPESIELSACVSQFQTPVEPTCTSLIIRKSEILYI